mmetsp:Transcript_30153/g.28805  ORF Transcript_30153/g.28805 Transcript_30153/m.28805 type:complete len:186 (-) Transcript_30153:193-750(-)
MTSASSSAVDELTVEQYLTQRCNAMIMDFQKHSADLISKLKDEYQDGALEIQKLMPSSSSSDSKKLCITLKCVGGPHIGQRFRLQPNSADGEDVFKMGRCDDDFLKERGVSLYKDRNVFYIHAKIEIRNAPYFVYFRSYQGFLVASSSTNGTQLNNVDVEAQVPLRLREEDVITMGTTELMVLMS